ncbi:hypothetical protein [Kordiimonas sp.]|uniref:hypothetical protein n=1 Tax=Kordiimonas sp. TaxID=1970157 RepID=UPI003A94858E
MIRQISVFVVAASLFMTPAHGATDEERAAEALQNAQIMVADFANERDEATLERIDRSVERVWQQLMEYYGMGSDLVPQLALLRARSASAEGDKHRTVPAWQLAIQSNSSISPAFVLGLNIEAAHAAAKVGDYDASARFFAAARAYAFVRGEQSEAARLQMRVTELQVLGGTMPWRDLSDALTDLRDFSETFPMWTLPRLEALLSEGEIRLVNQPEGNEKRGALSTLKAEILLMQKGMNLNLPATFTARIRAFFYALEDNYDL